MHGGQPHPSFGLLRDPQIPESAEFGEGEWQVGMKRKAEKSLDERRCIVVYLDSFSLTRARLASLPVLCSSGRELKSETQEELDALSSSPSAASGILPSVLRPSGGAFKGEF